MKIDDFEKQMQEQPIRQVPGHWRGPILMAARQAAARDAKDAAARAERRILPLAWLRQLIWPNPVAWGALATVWVVVLLLNFSATDKEPQIAKAAVESHEVMMAVKQQLKFQAELMSANDVPVAEPPKFSAPQSCVKPPMQWMAV